MTEPRMPNTLPSPVDRGEFRFVAMDAAGVAWRWIDDQMVWVSVEGRMETKDPGDDGWDLFH